MLFVPECQGKNGFAFHCLYGEITKTYAENCAENCADITEIKLCITQYQ